MTSTIWRRSEDWVGAEVEDSFVMVSIQSGKYVSLNRTADAIWRTLETPRSEVEIGEILRARFEVADDVCAEAVSTVLQDMRKLELAAPQQ